MQAISHHREQMSELYFSLEPTEAFIQSRKNVITELLEQKVDGFKMVEGIHQHPFTETCMEFANAALALLVRWPLRYYAIQANYIGQSAS